MRTAGECSIIKIITARQHAEASMEKAVYRSVVKPFFDFISSLLGAILLSPLFLIIAIIIKCTSKGPVLFKQDRIGKDKKIFKVWKFRTMRTDAPKDTPTHLLDNPDIYITKIGKVLRATSLDELPQIFNILAGKMSVVGPRPALYNQDDLVAERDKYNANSVRPGLTGWAQVNGRDELPIPVKAKFDGEYVEKCSILFDIKIFFKTFLKVLERDGVVEGKAGVDDLSKQYVDVDGTEDAEQSAEVATESVSEAADKSDKAEDGGSIVDGDAIVRRIAIFGKNSYVGNNFAEFVKDKGEYTVTKLNSRGDEWQGLSFTDYDVVLFVAGIAHVKIDKKDEDIYFKVNRDLAIAVAEKAKAEGVKQFVYLSSIYVFGMDGIVGKECVIDENTPHTDKFAYGVSKAQADAALAALQDENFDVAVIRPPMIYGRGSKGNFPRLKRLAKHLAFFPDYRNGRSMIYIKNLSSFLDMLIENGGHGIFYPQNREPVCTTDLYCGIRKSMGKGTLRTKLFNPLILLFGNRVGVLRKLFGNMAIDPSMSNTYGFEYCKYDLQQSLDDIEKGEK